MLIQRTTFLNPITYYNKTTVQNSSLHRYILKPPAIQRAFSSKSNNNHTSVKVGVCFVVAGCLTQLAINIIDLKIFFNERKEKSKFLPQTKCDGVAPHVSLEPFLDPAFVKPPVSSKPSPEPDYVESYRIFCT